LLDRDCLALEVFRIQSKTGDLFPCQCHSRRPYRQ
jgi:hypothetical protein